MSDPMPNDLEMCEAATPGPWLFDGDWSRLPTLFGGDRKIATMEKSGFPARHDHTGEQAANARFIAASREGWPAAIARAEKAEVEVARLREVLAHTKSALIYLDETSDDQHSSVKARLEWLTIETALEPKP